MTNDRLGRLFSLSRPGSVLQDDSVAVGVFESDTVAVPIRVEGRDRLETSGFHRLHGGFPLRSVGQIKDQEMVVGRRPASRMTVSMRELKMIRCAGTPKHYSVEAVMILKTEHDLETESIAVKTHQRVEIITGPGYA